MLGRHAMYKLENSGIYQQSPQPAVQEVRKSSGHNQILLFFSPKCRLSEGWDCSSWWFGQSLVTGYVFKITVQC